MTFTEWRDILFSISEALDHDIWLLHWAGGLFQLSPSSWGKGTYFILKHPTQAHTQKDIHEKYNFRKLLDLTQGLRRNYSLLQRNWPEKLLTTWAGKPMVIYLKKTSDFLNCRWLSCDEETEDRSWGCQRHLWAHTVFGFNLYTADGEFREQKAYVCVEGGRGCPEDFLCPFSYHVFTPLHHFWKVQKLGF